MALVDAYPAPRTKRPGGIPISNITGTQPSVPHTRLWHARMRTGIPNTFTRVVSPAFTGPAIVKQVSWCWTAGTGAAINPSWMLAWIDTPVAEASDAALPAPREGTFMIDTSHQDDTPKTLPLGYGSEIGLNLQNGGTFQQDTDYIITAPAFYLYAVTNAVANANHSIEFAVTVLCNVSPDALSFFH